MCRRTVVSREVSVSKSFLKWQEAHDFMIGLSKEMQKKVNVKLERT